MQTAKRSALSYIAETLFVAACVLGLAYCLIVGPGCKGTVPSPKQPDKRVTPEQAEMERDAIVREKEAERRAAVRRFKIAAEKIQAETGIELAELAAANDEAIEKADAEILAVKEATAAAIKAAEERQAAWVGGISTVATIAQSTGIPGVATFGGLLAGAVGLFSAASNRRKATTAEQIAAAEAAQRKATEEAAARVVDSIDILKMRSPEVAAAFKTHARDLIEWQGAAGMSLVSKSQHS